MDTKKRTAVRVEDWHRADILAALHKKGISLRQLSLAHDYNEKTLGCVFTRRWPRGEAIVAHALGMKASEIWPSRYVPKIKTVIPVLPPSFRQRVAA
ncbi:MAG: helix-turn-helix domain-containing protein [Burkholderiales bacterium]|jgi:Ner family transcriptional regulator|nr:helix-turn-helix domain-containing protein [Burkholderiales bacterium]